MKKNYFSPECEEVMIDLKYSILTGSSVIPGSKDGDDPEERDPNPDW